MIQSALAKGDWFGFETADKEWLQANWYVVVGMALVIYRHEGRREAREFIKLVRGLPWLPKGVKRNERSGCNCWHNSLTFSHSHSDS